MGHSQGTTQMFYALSKNADSNFWRERINLFVSVNPVVNFLYTDQPLLKFASQLSKVIKWPLLEQLVFPAFLTRGLSQGHYDAETYSQVTPRIFVPFYGFLEDFVESRWNPYNNEYRV